MTRLEQIEFETEEKFMDAIKIILAGKDAFRTYQDKDNKDVTKKIIGKNQLYLNNLGIRINKADNGKVYVSVNYFSFDDRMEIAKHKRDSNSTQV